MYQTIIGILGASFLTFIYVWVIKIPVWLKKNAKTFAIKPFTCDFCMAFWFCFFYQLTQNNLIDSLFISVCSPFLYLFIEDKILSKWEF